MRLKPEMKQKSDPRQAFSKSRGLTGQPESKVQVLGNCLALAYVHNILTTKSGKATVRLGSFCQAR
jgi:hypothetical protein